MHSWVNPILKIKKTKKGSGVFTSKEINKDTLLAIFGGYVMTLKEEKKLPLSVGDFSHQIHDEFVLGIKDLKEIDIAVMFNHSCSPNAGFNGQIFLVAMKKIKKGEEITFDYAMVLHRAKGVQPYKLKCLCGTKNCRKIITDNDWKKLDLQKKYRGYFQFYLEKKINIKKLK